MLSQFAKFRTLWLGLWARIVGFMIKPVNKTFPENVQNISHNIFSYYLHLPQVDLTSLSERRTKDVFERLCIDKRAAFRSFYNWNTVKARFTDTRLIRKSHYYEQFALFLEKESLHVFSKSTCLIRTPRSYRGFLWPVLSVLINGV